MDREYFENYCGRGSYAENYRYHSGIDHCISIMEHFDIAVESIAVLGAATGEVLRDFDEAFGVVPIGCEISAWAHRRIPAGYRAKIRCMDMRRYVTELVRREQSVDLIFSSALVYLHERQIPDLLAKSRRLGRYFHFLSSTSEAFEEGDRYRITLKPRSWWRARFLEAGFRPTRSRYLFR